MARKSLMEHLNYIPLHLLVLKFGSFVLNILILAFIRPLAFENLLSNIDDMLLDQPAVVEIMGNFIARSVADDCIPPKFIQSQMQAENISVNAK